MNPFLRTVKLALRHRATLTGVVVSSLFVGLLWGINIGAVYPFAQVVLHGKSLNQWLDGQIEKSESTITTQLSRLDGNKLADADDPPGRLAPQARRSALALVATERAKLGQYRWTKGLQNNKLPNSVQSNFISRVVFHSSTHHGTRFV